MKSLSIFSKNMFLSVLTIFVFLFTLANAQEIEQCKIKDNNLKSIKYFVGYTRRISQIEPNAGGITIDISINPENINKRYLILVTRKIKLQFCKETNMVVGIFDRKEVAKKFDTNIKEHLEALRGSYVLNSEKKEEFLSFSYTRDYNDNTKNRITVDFSKLDSEKLNDSKSFEISVQNSNHKKPVNWRYRCGCRNR